MQVFLRGCFLSFSSLFLNGDGETSCFPLSGAPCGAAASVFAFVYVVLWGIDAAVCMLLSCLVTSCSCLTLILSSPFLPPT